jgi:hypothetical protein
MRHRRLVGLLVATLVVQGGVARAQVSGDTAAVPQRDVMDILSRVLHGPPDSGVVDTPPKVVIAVLPAFSVNPAYGVLFGVSGTMLTRLGPEETTNASNASVSVNYTTKQQFNVLVRSNIYGPHNKLLLQGDYRYLDTSQPTYGLGPAQPESQKDELEYKLIRVYQTIYRPATGQVLAGIGYHLDSYFEIVDPNAEQGLPSPLLDYNGGKVETHNVASGLSLDLVYDDRDSPIYATTGYYINAGLRVYSTWLGSDSDWQSFQSEFRTYNRIGSRGVFAVWASNWFTFGKPPYLALPAIGWDTYARSGRGYPQGRIRGENQLYLEGEYRVSLSRDGFWGAAGFVSLLATTEPATERFGRVDPAGGVGLRIKLNKRSTTNITVDYAWGREGSNGLYLGTGEAF